MPDSVSERGSPPFQTADQVIARLEGEWDREACGILASDADGTLWDGDVGIDIFEALLAAEGVRDEARSALAAEARSIGLEPTGSATAITRDLYAAFHADRYAHDRAYAMMAWVFAGWHRDEVTAFATKVLHAAGLAARVRPAMGAILRWAEARSVPIYIVSASPLAVVEVGAARLGVTVTRTLAMTPAQRPDGVLLPELVGPVVYGEGKIQALEAAGAGSLVLGAFGDSAYDAAMLRIARVPVAVTPAPPLVALFPTIPGVVLLQR